MTKRTIAPVNPPCYVKRPVTTFRIREDFVKKVKEECDRLNCSRGVYFETLLLKAWQMNLVNATDVIGYDPLMQWAAQVVDIDLGIPSQNVAYLEAQAEDPSAE